MSSDILSLPVGPPSLTSYPGDLSTDYPGNLSAESKTKGVRPPLRLLRFRLLAEVASAQVRQQALNPDELEWQSLRIDLVFLHCRLNKLPPFDDAGSEIPFHLAALQRAIETDGPEHSSAEAHASRLHQLMPSKSAKELIAESWARAEAARDCFSLLSHHPDFSYVYRRSAEDFEMMSEPLSRSDALSVVERLDRGELSWQELGLATRVPVLPISEPGSGQKLWIEVDKEGYWVLLESFNRRYCLNLPFPCFTEAQHYLEGSLTHDLLAGLSPTADWRRSVFSA